jgi:hypothetical protein
VAAVKWLVDQLSLRIAIRETLTRRPDAGVDDTNYNVFASSGMRSSPSRTAELLPEAARCIKFKKVRRGRRILVDELVWRYCEDILLRRECGSLFGSQLRGKTIKANCVIVNLRPPLTFRRASSCFPLR